MAKKKQRERPKRPTENPIPAEDERSPGYGLSEADKFAFRTGVYIQHMNFLEDSIHKVISDYFGVSGERYVEFLANVLGRPGLMYCIEVLLPPALIERRPGYDWSDLRLFIEAAQTLRNAVAHGVPSGSMGGDDEMVLESVRRFRSGQITQTPATVALLREAAAFLSAAKMAIDSTVPSGDPLSQQLGRKAFADAVEIGAWCFAD